MTTPEQPAPVTPKDKYTVEKLGLRYRIDPVPEHLKEYLKLESGQYTFIWAGIDDVGNMLSGSYKKLLLPEKLGVNFKSTVTESHDTWQHIFEQSGALKESAHVEVGDISLNMFSYGSPANGKFEQIVGALQTLVNITPLARLYLPENIILLPTGMQTDRKELGDQPNGRAIYELNSIVFFPHMFNEPYHRITENRAMPQLDNITGTVAHEWMHLFDQNGGLYHPWWSVGDWSPVYKWDDASNGYQLTEEAEQPCITDYSRNNIQEDIAESGAAAMLTPELLQQGWPEKYRLLANFLGLNAELPPIEIKFTPQIDTSPKYPTSFLYKFDVADLRKVEQTPND
jgi:hypothetical protein